MDFKKITDIIQVALSFGGIAGMVFCMGIWAALLVSIRGVGLTVKLARMLLSYLTFGSATNFVLLCLFFGGSLFMLRDRVSDLLQELEPPVYLGALDSIPPDMTAGMFENEIMRINPPSVAAITIRSSRALADSLKIPVWWIYATALPECGLNPFTTRRDGIAAGWIQFTTAGLAGLGVSLEQVKQWCRNGETEQIMRLTDRYMRRAAQGHNLTRPVDVYLCVFSPASVGKAESAVLYEGYNNPAYYLNAGLDGYSTDGKKITYRHADKDGRITVRELALCLEYKRQRQFK